jgi:hypothetical protein
MYTLEKVSVVKQATNQPVTKQEQDEDAEHHCLELKTFA